MYIETNATCGSTDQSVEDFLDALSKRAPDFLVLSCSSQFHLPKVKASLSKTEAKALHGSTSCLGVMTNAGMTGQAGDGIGYFALWDGAGAYGSAGAPFLNDAQAAARNATNLALERAKRPGEAPDLIWVSASPGQEEAIIRGIESVVGAGIPIVGGSAADNTVQGNWATFGADGITSDGVQISVLFPSRPLAAEFQSGYAPNGKSARATRAKGRRLYELDGRPAAAVYQELSGLSFEPAPNGGSVSILSRTSFNPIGVEMATVSHVPYYLLMHAAVLHDDGSIEFFADIDEGTVLYIMTGSPQSLTSRAGRVALQTRKRIDGPQTKPAGALVIYCAGCMLSITDKMNDVAAGVDQSLDGVPFLGVFTFGEQGFALDQKNSHGNLMISCVTFAA